MIKIILILLAATAAVCAAYTGPISQEETPVIVQEAEQPDVTDAAEIPKAAYPAQPETEAEQPIDGTDVSLRDLWEMTHE